MALPEAEGADAYASEVAFGVHHQGGPGIVHGGIVGAALDEACGLLATWHRFPTVTARIAIRYRRPRPDQPAAPDHVARHRRARPQDRDRGRAARRRRAARRGGRRLPARPARALPRDAGGPRGRRAWRAARTRRRAAGETILQTPRMGDFREHCMGDAVSRSLRRRSNPTPPESPMSRIILVTAAIAGSLILVKSEGRARAHRPRRLVLDRRHRRHLRTASGGACRSGHLAGYPDLWRESCGRGNEAARALLDAARLRSLTRARRTDSHALTSAAMPPLTSRPPSSPCWADRAPTCHADPAARVRLGAGLRPCSCSCSALGRPRRRRRLRSHRCSSRRRRSCSSSPAAGLVLAAARPAAAACRARARSSSPSWPASAAARAPRARLAEPPLLLWRLRRRGRLAARPWPASPCPCACSRRGFLGLAAVSALLCLVLLGSPRSPWSRRGPLTPLRNLRSLSTGFGISPHGRLETTESPAADCSSSASCSRRSRPSRARPTSSHRRRPGGNARARDARRPDPGADRGPRTSPPTRRSEVDRPRRRRSARG